MKAPAYGKSIFINCPIDDDYKPISDAVVFTVLACGFIARSALEHAGSERVRIDKIVKIIEECRFGYHDISRTELDEEHSLPRFNMPFELGIFLGAKYLGQPKQKKKKYLVVDKTPHDYQKSLSDISGQDVPAHANKPKKAVEIVRNWLGDAANEKNFPGGGHIWRRYELFRADLPAACEQASLDPDGVTFNDYTVLIYGWLTKNPPDKK